ncbi:hypothetical protein SERLA73DRAFT_157688 [Serpula lacrymans var. lacrymans S7.3]|uniref:Uncharacterized protein n=1 Tax=Serpula lacrymans var. lacrymans (strain S7.3) TaxID=936435 RepID=F8PHK9_SERL3|nr:hypothetical protein SERLA73DRAFT_157688 [Serpula lacrymans var. lacrymans S7.3]
MSTHTAPITTSEDQVQPIIEQIDRNLKYNSQDVYVQQFYIEPSSFPEFVDKLRESDYSTLRYMYDHVKGILQLSMPTPVHGVFIERLSELLQGKLSGLIRWSDGMFKLSSNMFKFLWRGQITTVPDLALKFQCLNPSTKWQELLIFEFSHSQSVGDITQKVKKYWEELSHLVSILVVKFYESHKYAKPRYGMTADGVTWAGRFVVDMYLYEKDPNATQDLIANCTGCPLQSVVLRQLGEGVLFTLKKKWAGLFDRNWVFKEKMAHLPSMVDRTCPACGKLLKTPQGVMAHLSMSAMCAWYRKGKRRELEADNLGLEQVVYDEVNLDENVCNQEDYDLDGSEDIFLDSLQNPFKNCKATPRITSLSSKLKCRELGVVEQNENASKVIRVDMDAYNKWRESFHQFNQDDDEMDIDLPYNRWALFSTELDWKFAHWALQEGVGQKSLDRLLVIPELSQRLGLSYQNSRSLLKIIDSKIPERAKWHSKYLHFDDCPEEKHLIQYRDPLQAIASLLGNPAHATDIVYKPSRIFTNSNRDDCIFDEMWTWRWWHSVQALLPQGASVAPVIIVTDKTQLTQFSGNKSAYPVYLTLGYIPSSIRHKPSQHVFKDFSIPQAMSGDLLKVWNMSQVQASSNRP